MKKQQSTYMTIDPIATSRYALYLPVLVLIIGQITGYLDRSTQNQHPSALYYSFARLWDISLFALPIIGIIWGIVAWKRRSGKLAVVINVAFLIYVLLYPHSYATGF